MKDAPEKPDKKHLTKNGFFVFFKLFAVLKIFFLGKY